MIRLKNMKLGAKVAGLDLLVVPVFLIVFLFLKLHQASMQSIIDRYPSLSDASPLAQVQLAQSLNQSAILQIVFSWLFAAVLFITLWSGVKYLVYTTILKKNRTWKGYFLFVLQILVYFTYVFIIALSLAFLLELLKSWLTVVGYANVAQIVLLCGFILAFLPAAPFFLSCANSFKELFKNLKKIKKIRARTYLKFFAAGVVINVLMYLTSRFDFYYLYISTLSTFLFFVYSKLLFAKVMHE